MSATPLPVSQVLLGASVRAKFTGQVTATTPSPVVTLDDGSGLAVTLPGALVVDVRSDALPITADSVVRASVNGGPLETLVLAPNVNAVLKWRRVLAGAFVQASDTLDAIQVVFIAGPTAATRPPGGQP